MVDQTGNVLAAPGWYQGDESTDVEILYSTAGFTQKGGTLKPGQGIIPAGCIVAYETASKKWVVYNNSGSGGAEVARGVLRKAVDTGTSSTAKGVLGNIVIAGILKNSLLSGSDSGAITDLGARVDTVLGTFSFGH